MLVHIEGCSVLRREFIDNSGRCSVPLVGNDIIFARDVDIKEFDAIGLVVEVNALWLEDGSPIDGDLSKP